MLIAWGNIIHYEKRKEVRSLGQSTDHHHHHHPQIDTDDDYDDDDDGR